jgi:Xaa-Pro aminopeptidase
VNDRIGTALKELEKLNLDFLLVSSPVNVRYLTGFIGETVFLLISKRLPPMLLTDFRFIEQAKDEAEKGIEVKALKDDVYSDIANIISNLKGNRIGFESLNTSYHRYEKLRQKIKAHLIPTTLLIEKQRTIKSEKELLFIKEAVSITEDALSKVQNKIKTGVSEKELALDLEYQLKTLGSDGLAFDPIVATGKRSSMPHAKPSDKKIEEGDIILIDCGGRFNGYCADITRCFSLGKPAESVKEIFKTVKDAQATALEKIILNASCKDIDSVARNFIKDKGYEGKFGHSLGHGVGLEVHELPSLSPKSKDTVSAGMVFTIEPGIYIEGFAGIRIEDMVHIKSDGNYELLTSFSSELVEV